MLYLYDILFYFSKTAYQKVSITETDLSRIRLDF